MPRKFNPDSLRNQPGFTVRATPADRRVIAAHAKRWGCGLSEATMRLAMAGAQHQGTDPQQERLEVVEQWLRDGFGLPKVIQQAKATWGATPDDAFRLIDSAIAVVDALDPRQSDWAKLRDRVDRHGSLEKWRRDGGSHGDTPVERARSRALHQMDVNDLRIW
jgi:hypothetical protein